MQCHFTGTVQPRICLKEVLVPVGLCKSPSPAQDKEEEEEEEKEEEENNNERGRERGAGRETKFTSGCFCCAFFSSSRRRAIPPTPIPLSVDLRKFARRGSGETTGRTTKNDEKESGRRRKVRKE